MRYPGSAFAAVLLAVSAYGAEPDCPGLSQAEIPGLVVQRSAVIEPGRDIQVTPASAPTAIATPRAFCRVEGRIDATIGFELWLPREWNGKFFSSGVGGYAGRIGVQGMLPALARGYATSSTDTGHQGDDATFMQDPAALENYAYRGVHRTAEVSKALIRRYYGRPHDFAYFSGCSGGGYAGLANAQRYPGDYNGIVSGAPGTLVTHHAARAMWNAAINADGRPGRIPSDKDDLIPGAFIATCDALDGVRDGLVENPLACDFNLASLQCPGNETSSRCLTAAQVDTARRLYGPMQDDSGRLIYPATAPGTPLPADALERRGEFYAAFWKNAVFDPGWDPATFTVADVEVADRKLRAYLDAGNPDLSAFRERGGKLILYHGWYDAGVSPLNTIDYYERMERADGAFETRDYARLFLAPGMAHCAGGIGPDRFDTLTAMEDWVERGRAPERLVATQLIDEMPLRTRPLCPYPEVAVYAGAGDTDTAANFRCAPAAPRVTPMAAP